MVCHYCGLATGSSGSHRTEAECIQALAQEVEKTRRSVEQLGPRSARDLGEKAQNRRTHRENQSRG